MPNYLSQYRSTFGLERLEKNGDYDGRTITINVGDFGTIVSSVESSTDARNNAMVFVKAYEYALTKICSMNVEVIINVPAGDYYFPDDDNDNNNFIILNAPQYGQIGIYGAGRTGTRPTPNQLDDTFDTTRTLLKNYYRTRFHFSRNGFSLPGAISGTTRSSFLFNEIAFFGLSNGYNKLSSNNIRRAFAGSYRLQYCAVHGFTTTNHDSSEDTGNCYGISSAHGHVDLYSIIVSHCGRGLYASNGGSIASYSANSDADRDIITRIAWEAVLSANASSVRVGSGAAYRSILTSGTGANTLYAYNNGVIVSKTPTLNGSAMSSSNYTVTNGGVVQITSGPDGG